MNGKSGTEERKIVLTTLNARYSHTAFGLRYLLANMGKLKPQTRMLEFDIRTPFSTILNQITEIAPAILGIGVYIWNAARIVELLPLLRQALPNTTIILGGPEVICDTDPILEQAADFIVSGEGDLAFAELCSRILQGNPPTQKIVVADPPNLTELAPPYSLYTDNDIAHRTVYVETSRGCPFECEYCLSSRDRVVRYFPLPDLFAQFDDLLHRGARHFKFTDRSMNLQPDRCEALLEFFRKRYEPGLFLHFEMLPDRFPDSLKTRLQEYPAGGIQLEIGIQTLNPDVARLIRRRQDMDRSLDNLRFLREETGAYLHTDLIAGLPGETPESFADGFDRLAACRPHEIQFGILKRLRGAAIGRHDAEWKMHYNSHPPYNLISNRLIDAGLMKRYERFAAYWDKTVNSGRFPHTTPLLWDKTGSVFSGFMAWSDWLFEQTGKTYGISLTEWTDLLFRYLTGPLKQNEETIARSLLADFGSRPLRHIPIFLRRWMSEPVPSIQPRPPSNSPLRRQRRHLN